MGGVVQGFLLDGHSRPVCGRVRRREGSNLDRGATTPPGAPGVLRRSRVFYQTAARSMRCRCTARQLRPQVGRWCRRAASSARRNGIGCVARSTRSRCSARQPPNWRCQRARSMSFANQVQDGGCVDGHSGNQQRRRRLHEQQHHGRSPSSPAAGGCGSMPRSRSRSPASMRSTWSR